MNQHRLYARGEPVLQCYLIEEGRLAVGLGATISEASPCRQLVAGTLESYLRGPETTERVRLFDLYVEPKSAARPMPLYRIREQEREYEFGVWSNVFLAICLDQTNSLVRLELGNLTLEEQQYRLRARLFRRLFRDIAELARRLKKPELEKVCEGFYLSPLLAEGERLEIEQAVGAIQLPSIEMTRFVEEFPAQHIICKEGEGAECMYALLRGRIGVYVEGRRISTIQQPGESFGEAALFLDGKRTATLVTDEATAVYRVPRSGLRAFHESHPDLFVNISMTLARRAAANVKQVDDCFALRDPGSLAARRAVERHGMAKVELRRFIGKFERTKASLRLPELEALWAKYSETLRVE